MTEQMTIDPDNLGPELTALRRDLDERFLAVAGAFRLFESRFSTLEARIEAMEKQKAGGEMVKINVGGSRRVTSAKKDPQTGEWSALIENVADDAVPRSVDTQANSPPQEFKTFERRMNRHSDHLASLESRLKKLELRL